MQITDLLIVAEMRFYGEGLADVLGRSPGIRVVGIARSRQDCLIQIRDGRPRVVLIDMGMSESFSAVKSMMHLAPAIDVVALGVAETEADVLACVEAGVSGYVSQDASIAELIATIKSAVCGDFECPPQIARCLIRRVQMLSERRAPSLSTCRLTARETEITELLGCGLSNKQIARALHIEISTVKNHVHHILEKLQVKSRSEAVDLMREQVSPR
jgi:DNA-binding NarL/FixJ family response regulator